MERRPRWLLMTYIGVSLVLPTLGAVIRWTGGATTSKFGWHMFSTSLGG